MKKTVRFVLLLSCFIFITSCSKPINLERFGLTPECDNATPVINNAIAEALKGVAEGDTVELLLAPGRYDFYPDSTMMREYYISNHDQDNPKAVGIALEGLSNVIINGQGAELIFHGRMLPVSLVNSTNCTLRNLTIDFETPHISQVEIVENDTVAGFITYRPAPWVEYEIRDSVFVTKGLDWELVPQAGIAFEPDTRHIVYNTSDIFVGVNHVEETDSGLIRAPWQNPKLVPGSIVAMRGYERPTPGIFLADDKDIILENVTVHYAEGMGLVAQMTENIVLNGFNVCLRGDSDSRYFTTQADATHFSGCKGRIVSVGGLYEGMMDDAINVHGTYLKVVNTIDSVTVEGEYQHYQTYGFRWGEPGDSVQFVVSSTMETVGSPNVIADIQPVDGVDMHGAKRFQIRFNAPMDLNVDMAANSIGLENLEWTPEVYFADNVVRNNRARGALFSTPRSVIVEHNTFDHTSGTAILLCGDCNGWYETGACRDVVIRNNKFINALTNMFQFTNAVISIYPEIPDLNGQHKYFHSGIVITDNEFETFDMPLLYAKSVDGLVFSGNKVTTNNEYPAFHWNKQRVLLERVANADIQPLD